MNKPKLTQAEALKLIEPFGMEDVPVKVLAIRGYYKKTMGNPLVNDRGIFDDAFFVISPDIFAAFNGNVDPSVRRNNIATLVTGVYWFKPGDHALGKKSQHPAFRQDSNVTVTRDGREGVFTDSPQKRFWINNHRAGYYTTSSEGCLTIYRGQWDAYYATVMDQLKRFNQKRFPIILIEL